MRRVAIVSHYFPPSTMAGVHRARIMSAHLHRFGWKPTIFCVDERHHEQSLDPELAKLVPGHVEVRKVAALPTGLTRCAGIGDIGIRSHHAMRAALLRYFREEGGDLLFVTVPPGYGAMLAPAIRRRCRVPVVLDYRDPWVSKWGADQPRWSKAGLSHQLAVRLEPRALAHADHVTGVSPGTCEGIRARHPRMPPENFSVLPIGAEPADFEYLRAHPRPWPAILGPRDQQLHLTQVGTLAPRAGGTLGALLAALAEVRRREPSLARRLRVNFVGTSNRPDGVRDFKVIPVARDMGVAEFVTEVPQRLPYLEALNLLIQSDGLLALGSDEPHYTASRIFPHLLARRPLLGLYHTASSVCAIAAEAQEVTVITHDHLQPPESHVSRVADVLEQWLLRGRVADLPSRDARLQEHLSENIARGFAALFDWVCVSFDKRCASEGKCGTYSRKRDSHCGRAPDHSRANREGVNHVRSE
jgi:hypothetical protein